MVDLSRRQALAFYSTAAGLALVGNTGFGRATQPELGGRLPPWTPGELEIHHLATGRGDATVIVAPDGSIALIDAGSVARPDPALVATSAEAARDTGKWIADYIGRRLRDTGGSAVDAAAITHLHPDHVGAVLPNSHAELGKAYQPTGISSVAGRLPLRKLVDPCYLDYGYPPLEDRASIENYIAFVRAFAAAGKVVERARVGSTGQVLPDLIGPMPFSIRTVAARGSVWTGQGDDARSIFPARATLAEGNFPNENAMSAAFLLSFGDFRYFSGGDLTDWADAGTRPWMNALTPAARAVGRVDVAKLPHHGMFDGSSGETIRALAARDWIISAWHAAHPSIETLERVYNPRLFAGERDVYATALHPAAELVMGRLTSRFRSKRGNVICRVAADGKSYRIVVTDASTDDDRVTRISPVRIAIAVNG